jgi:hypothetical protein
MTEASCFRLAPNYGVNRKKGRLNQSITKIAHS